MLASLTVSMDIDARVAGAIVALGGVLFTIWINGDRAERQRRRDLHARALASVLAYGEMPFVVRRRRCEPEHASSERVRISDHFSSVKAEVETCRVLLNADGDQKLSTEFHELVETARATAGAEAHVAWKEAPVKDDREMNMGQIFERLEDLRLQLGKFTDELAWATLARRKKLWRTVRRQGSGSGTGTESSAR